MAIDYSKILYDSSVLPPQEAVKMAVAIPVQVYRVEVADFRGSLNFFQKYILRFKLRPDMSHPRLAEFMGIDEKLLHVILNELVEANLLNESYNLTAEGERLARNPYEIITDKERRKVGFVLRYADQETYYPYFLEALPYAEIKKFSGTRPKLEKLGHLDYLEQLWFKNVQTDFPTSGIISRLVRNTLKNNDLDDSMVGDAAEESSLSVRFLEEGPEKMWLALWVYLPKFDQEAYAPDWEVLDPFGYGTNPDIKFNLKKEENTFFLQKIDEIFGNKKTVLSKNFLDYRALVRDKALEKLSSYASGLKVIDQKCYDYATLIEEHFIKLTDAHFIPQAYTESVNLIMDVHKALESLFKLDRTYRPKSYERMLVEHDYQEKYQRRSDLTKVLKSLGFSEGDVPKVYLDISERELSNPTSLRPHIVCFLLTHKFNQSSPLFEAIKGKLWPLNTVSVYRNEDAHGQIGDQQIVALPEKDLRQAYHFFRTFITEYLKHNYE
jgi:hypothetical protein